MRVHAPWIDFSALRRELNLPEAFPPDAQAEAEQSARRSAALAGKVADRTDIECVTIDAPDWRDLDQAMCIVKRSSGYRVHYAIADVLSFVAPGGALDGETWQRGQTIYFQDDRVPLNPLFPSGTARACCPTRPARPCCGPSTSTP